MRTFYGQYAGYRYNCRHGAGCGNRSDFLVRIMSMALKDVSLASASVDGVAYGAPWFSGASGIVYRKDIFDEKG